ncbi:MAG: DUF3344 domain-containing protein [Methanosarcinales archaeon]|nr:MAG: DUF3344 domain-containing protein [Methanosarcinales archaeon]
MKSRISLVCIVVLMVMVVPGSAAPDLSVTDVIVNPGDTRSDDLLRVYVNGGNVISAVVQNSGPDAVTGDFSVCFAADNVVIGCANVTGGLAADENTTISINWTPSCEDYPVMPGFPPQSLPLTITVAADCNCDSCPNCPDDGSSGTINETNETDNTLSLVIPATQKISGYDVIGGVVNNGYMSKNFDCDATEEPLQLVGYLDEVNFDMVANVSGTKISAFAPQTTDTRVHHIDLPDGAVVLGAGIYVDWYDDWGNYKTYPTGCLANLSMNFEGVDIMPEVVHYDSKAFGYYQSPKGSSVFNVSSLVSESGDYTSIIENIEPIGGNNTTLLGQVLGVYYIGADHGGRVQFWMLGGTDYLMAADDTHGSSDYSVSPESATATVAFPGEICLTDVVDAKLITFVTQGMSSGSDLLLNGEVIKTNAWNASTEAYPGSKINVEAVSVLSKLLPSNNTMGFRDNGSGGMQAGCAILTVVHAPAPDTPDLSVESVALNCDQLFGNRSNEISATIVNNGADCDESFNVSFVLSDGFSTVESVDALAFRDNTTVSIIDPTIRNAGAEVTITVTADCCGGITEGNESNNETTLDTTVVNNGYNGKTYTGGENITTWKTFDLNGDLVYSAGDSYYLSSYSNKHWTEYISNWTASNLSVPAAATVVEARLYVSYTYEKADVMPDNVSMDFNGITQTLDAHYCDAKLYAASKPYGMITYNVTNDFSADGNIAKLTNAHTGGGNVSMRGMMLVVTYEDASEPRRQIAVNEGFDLLYGGSKQCTTPDEATAWAPITGLTIDPSATAGARLITCAPGADPTEGELIFNGQIWADEWNDNGAHQIGISDRDVTQYLQQTGNVVGFRSSEDYMEASNVILIIEEGDTLADSDSDGVPDCWDTEDNTPPGYLTDSEGRGYRIGDVNRDGELTSVDALMILQAIAEYIEL